MPIKKRMMKKKKKIKSEYAMKDVDKLNKNIKKIEEMRKRAEEDEMIKPQMAIRLTEEESAGFVKKEEKKPWYKRLFG